jgi:hypothetical protein
MLFHDLDNGSLLCSLQERVVAKRHFSVLMRLQPPSEPQTLDRHANISKIVRLSTCCFQSPFSGDKMLQRVFHQHICVKRTRISSKMMRMLSNQSITSPQNAQSFIAKAQQNGSASLLGRFSSNGRFDSCFDGMQVTRIDTQKGEVCKLCQSSLFSET